MVVTTFRIDCPAFNEAVSLCRQNRTCSPDFTLMVSQGRSEILLKRVLGWRAPLIGK